MIPSQMPAVEINKRVLAEMEVLAITADLNIDKLNYRETQQVLTLMGLKRYLESLGLECSYDFSADLGTGRSNER